MDPDQHDADQIDHAIAEDEIQAQDNEAHSEHAVAEDELQAQDNEAHTEHEVAAEDTEHEVAAILQQELPIVIIDFIPSQFTLGIHYNHSCALLCCAITVHSPSGYYCCTAHQRLAEEWSMKSSSYRIYGGLKEDSICIGALILKTKGVNAGIPTLQASDTFGRVPWENPNIFNCDFMEGEVNRGWLFFADPPANFTVMINSEPIRFEWKKVTQKSKTFDKLDIFVTELKLVTKDKAEIPPGWRMLQFEYSNQSLYCLCHTRPGVVKPKPIPKVKLDSKGAGQGKKDDKDDKDGKGDKRAVAKKRKTNDGAKIPGTSSSDPVAATEEFMPSEVSLQSPDTEQSLMDPTSELEAASENGDKSEDTDSEEKDQAVDGLSSDLDSIGLEDSVAHAVEAEESNDAAAFAVDNGADFFNNFPAKPHTPASTSAQDFMPPESSDPVFDDAIQRALVVGYYKEAVDQCISANKMADALVIAHVGGTALWESTREKYLRTSSAPYMKVVSAMMKNDHLTSLVSTRSHKFWKETLALLSAFAQGEEWAVPCDALASKLMDAGNTLAAVLCYLGAGNVDRTVERSLANERDGRSYAEHLQDLMEKTLVLALATGNKRFSTSLCKLFESYAEMLASQGLLTTEMKYLKFLDSGGLSPELSVLRDRIALSAEPETDTAAPDNTQPQSTIPYSQQSSPPAHESSAQPSMTTTFVPLTPPALTRFFDETSEALGGVEKHDTEKVSLCL